MILESATLLTLTTCKIIYYGATLAIGFYVGKTIINKVEETLTLYDTKRLLKLKKEMGLEACCPAI